MMTCQNSVDNARAKHPIRETAAAIICILHNPIALSNIAFSGPKQSMKLGKIDKI